MKMQKKIKRPFLLVVACAVLGGAIGVYSSNVVLAEEGQCADFRIGDSNCTNGSCSWHSTANAYQCDYWGTGCGHPSCSGPPLGD